MKPRKAGVVIAVRNLRVHRAVRAAAVAPCRLAILVETACVLRARKVAGRAYMEPLRARQSHVVRQLPTVREDLPVSRPHAAGHSGYVALFVMLLLLRVHSYNPLFQHKACLPLEEFRDQFA